MQDTISLGSFICAMILDEDTWNFAATVQWNQILLRIKKSGLENKVISILFPTTVILVFWKSSARIVIYIAFLLIMTFL